MKITIIERIMDEDFENMKSSEDPVLTLDLANVEFLGSRDITRLLILIKSGKRIEFVNTNQHIMETLRILKIDDLIKVNLR